MYGSCFSLLYYRSSRAESPEMFSLRNRLTHCRHGMNTVRGVSCYTTQTGDQFDITYSGSFDWSQLSKVTGKGKLPAQLFMWVFFST